MCERRRFPYGSISMYVRHPYLQDRINSTVCINEQLGLKHIWINETYLVQYLSSLGGYGLYLDLRHRRLVHAVRSSPQLVKLFEEVLQLFLVSVGEEKLD